nr:histone H1-like [Plodia interpunctella]
MFSSDYMTISSSSQFLFIITTYLLFCISSTELNKEDVKAVIGNFEKFIKDMKAEVLKETTLSKKPATKPKNNPIAKHKPQLKTKTPKNKPASHPKMMKPPKPNMKMALKPNMRMLSNQKNKMPKAPPQAKRSNLIKKPDAAKKALRSEFVKNIRATTTTEAMILKLVSYYENKYHVADIEALYKVPSAKLTNLPSNLKQMRESRVPQ